MTPVYTYNGKESVCQSSIGCQMFWYRASHSIPIHRIYIIVLIAMNKYIDK